MRTPKQPERINLKDMSNLQNDNVFVKSEIKSLAELTGGITGRRGLEQAVISEGKIVNVVSGNYGHLPNEVFFAEIERKLNSAGIKYVKRSINRNNCSFAVDYILNDENFIVSVKKSADKIRPMLRFVNAYDGSNKTSGHFGFYREVCTNGLHVGHFDIGFSTKHRGNIAEIVLPEILSLTNKFMDNDYYTISRKFEVLAEKALTDLEGFVKLIADKTKLFKFESSEKNPLPCENARTVIQTIKREAEQLGTNPTLWLGYNALNELLHDKMQKSFEKQKSLDAVLFNAVSELI